MNNRTSDWLVLIRSKVAGFDSTGDNCWAGRGRTGTVVGCYLKRHGMAEDADVIQKLAVLRRGALNGKETSPQTKEQIRMVTSWKKGV
jgi:protein-tyrosine phosphatase